MIAAIVLAACLTATLLADLSHIPVTDSLKRYSHLCPDLPGNLYFSNIASYHFYTTHAEIALTIAPDSTNKTFYVIFSLPALPPFARSVRPEHPDPEYDRGDKNWAFTGTYIHDYAFRLVEHAQLVNIHDEGESVRCAYRSLVENHFIYGHIVTEKDGVTA